VSCMLIAKVEAGPGARAATYKSAGGNVTAPYEGSIDLIQCASTGRQTCTCNCCIVPGKEKQTISELGRRGGKTSYACSC